jgi:hypothetical protein
MNWYVVAIALILLHGATWAFIVGLIWFRRVRPGDYTALKVVIGDALIILCQIAILTWAGLPSAWADGVFVLVAPYIAAGGPIIGWQLVEWWGRKREREQRRVQQRERELAELRQLAGE